MAKINGTVGANSSAYEFYIEWTESEVNIANNTSKITATSYIKCTAHTAYDNATYAHTVTIDGTVFTVNVAGINLSAGVTKQLATGSKVVTHNVDGAKNITISANSPNLPSGAGYGPVKGSASGTAVLTTIPRATTPTLSASTADLGANVIINTPGASSAFTHDITYAIGNLSGTIATEVATSTTWVIPKTLANTITTSTSGIVTITCNTKNGSTTIGSKTINLTVTIPDTAEFRPIIQPVTIKDDNTAVANKFNAYVQNQSKFNISFTRSGIYGSTITADKITANNQSFNSNSAVTNAISGSGNQSIVCTTTDSRNRSVEIPTNVNVLPYQAPLISSFSAVRANSDGTENNDGTYAKVAINASITALNNLNNKSFKVQYKPTTSSTWTVQDVTPASEYTLNTSVIIPNFSVDNTYNIQLLVQDFFTTTQSAIINFPTSFTLIDFHNGGKGVAFGKVSETANAVEVAPAMDFILNGASIFKTKSLPFTADTLENWCSLKTGRYLSSNAGLANQPSTYGIIDVINVNPPSLNDGTAIWYTQQSGAIYRKSWNSATLSGWTRVDGGTTYRVGDIIMSTSNANPNANYGGAWVAWGSERVPVGMGGKYGTVEAAGGADSIALDTSNLPSHTHSFSFTTSNGGAHTHQYKYYTGATTGSYDFQRPYTATTYVTGTGNGPSAGDHNHTGSGTTGGTGSGAGHENRQQFITCYMWKKTAN